MMYNYIKKWKGDAKKMLLNFKMENFRSFKDETFFTMLSSKQKTHNDYVIDKSVNIFLLFLSFFFWISFHFC